MVRFNCFNPAFVIVKTPGNCPPKFNRFFPFWSEIFLQSFCSGRYNFPIRVVRLFTLETRPTGIRKQADKILMSWEAQLTRNALKPLCLYRLHWDAESKPRKWREFVALSFKKGEVEMLSFHIISYQTPWVDLGTPQPSMIQTCFQCLSTWSNLLTWSEAKSVAGVLI